MNHSFNVEIAIKYGVQEAIIIENIYFWIQKNKANNKHFYDGEYWTYNSVKAFNVIFPYWTERQITKILKKAEDKKLIRTGNYNEKQYDRTKWYTLTETVNCIYFISQIHLTDRLNGFNQKVEPIPDINTDIKHNYKTNIYIGDFSEKIISAFNEFKLMRKNIKKPLTAGAEKRILEKLKNLSNNEEEQIKIINQSIDHCWQDFYQLKGEENGRNRKNKCDYSENSSKYDGI
jgi:hypothetical protein